MLLTLEKFRQIFLKIKRWGVPSGDRQSGLCLDIGPRNHTQNILTNVGAMPEMS